MTDHAELARLAEAASDGPWAVDADDVGRAIVASPVSIVARDTRHNSEFIAAANPARVLALLAEIAALRGERDELLDALWRIANPAPAVRPAPAWVVGIACAAINSVQISPPPPGEE